jgi:hypothetical protein
LEIAFAIGDDGMTDLHWETVTPLMRDVMRTVGASDLVYFERADQDAPLPLLHAVEWSTVKTFLREQAIQLGQAWLKDWNGFHIGVKALAGLVRLKPTLQRQTELESRL